ncbi:MAG: hypothetical protein NVSMB62_06320 [Acidobacteriaceae bacterium]
MPLAAITGELNSTPANVTRMSGLLKLAPPIPPKSNGTPRTQTPPIP